MSKYLAELIGTFWLVFAGCGSIIFSQSVEGIGYLGVAFAFGLSLMSISYAIGHISGAHLNPAVSVGLWLSGRFNGRQILPYIISQLLGSLLGAGCLLLIAREKPGFSVESGFASNGFGIYSPEGYSMIAAIIVEMICSLILMLVVLGATDRRAARGNGPLAIGLCYTLIHIISLPITNTSVNPARSTGVAIFAGGPAIEQLWLFWLAPLLGAAIGASCYRWMQPPRN